MRIEQEPDCLCIRPEDEEERQAVEILVNCLLGRQLDVMDEYALILRRRASIEHIDLGEQPVTGILRDTRPNKENQ